MLHTFLFPSLEQSLSCLNLSLSKCRGYGTATCGQCLLFSVVPRHLWYGKPVSALRCVYGTETTLLCSFAVVMYGCESWTIKKAECWRIDASELWFWRRLLRVPWSARRSNQSILKEISPEYLLKDWCWSWNSNTLATWCEELTHWKRPWCWERLKAEEGDDRGCDGYMVSPTQWTWVWINSGSWWWTGRPSVLQSLGLQRVVHKWATELKGTLS